MLTQKREKVRARETWGVDKGLADRDRLRRIRHVPCSYAPFFLDLQYMVERQRERNSKRQSVQRETECKDE